MTSFYPCGRLGTELSQLPLYALEMLVKHCPDEDPLLKGGTLEFIIKRIAILSERDYDEVKCEVTQILKEKHDMELAKGSNSFIERMNRRYRREDFTHRDYLGATDSIPVNREYL